MSKKILFRSTDCVPVEGARRGIIYDLGRRTHYSFPVDYVKMLKSTSLNFDLILSEYEDEEDRQEIERFKSFLIEKEVVHSIPADLHNNFPQLGFDFCDPGQIANCIADYERDSPYDLKSFVEASVAIGARHFLIRSYKTNYTESEFLDLLNIFDDTPVRSFELILKYNENLESAVRINHTAKIRCKSIVLHSAPKKEYIMPSNNTAMGILALTLQNIESPSQCHNNSLKYMNVNLLFFLESLNYHPYFNKKLSIDVNGLLKNCPSHTNDFGQFGTQILSSVVESEEFQAKWKITKDKINVCRDCEYRHMCSDSRNIYQNPNGTWSHDSPCSYDPYNATWK